MNQTILTYEDILPVKIGSSTEDLVDARTFDLDIQSSYKKFDMIPITGTTILVRRELAKRLAIANIQLTKQYNYRLKIVYGYRSPQVQARYFNMRRDVLRSEYPELASNELDRLTHNFVAVPDVAGHPTGGAIDITLVDGDGIECDMGTDIAEYTDPERIKTFNSTISSLQRKNREILLEAMTSVGFAPFFGEWWHFSYGDREWAAYYSLPSAIYGPMDYSAEVSLLTSAGGNGTVIKVQKRPLSAIERQNQSAALLRMYEEYGAEQVGYLRPSKSRLDMAGGEFCANATCVAAVMLSEYTNKTRVKFTVSGFQSEVIAKIRKVATNAYGVDIELKNMRYTIQQESWNQSRVTIVDFGGIVHMLIEGTMPTSEKIYRDLLQSLLTKFKLELRDAVGLIWYRLSDGVVDIDPLVWVRAVESCFYESSCGSGSIAAAIITGANIIQQPSGGRIVIKVLGKSIRMSTRIDKLY